MNRASFTKGDIMSRYLLVFLFSSTLAFSQPNTWQRMVANDSVSWTQPAFFYSPATGEFVMTMGSQDETGANSPYCVQVYKPGINRWINALPSNALYGTWADSTGYARNNGRCGNAVFGTYYWAFAKIDGYLRPNTGAYKTTRAYGQCAFNTTDGKAYFYINNCTFTYNPSTRLWDTIATPVHPNSGAAESYLKWGSLCYDGFNQEIVLCGGGAVDKDSSHVGTWIFKPSTAAWTELALGVQPGPRANTAMAFDGQNNVIVLFGGDHLDYYYGDTWIYDCAAKIWSQRHPSMNPKPRAGHSMVYLPKSKKVVLLGGYSRAGDQASVYEMWAYDYTANAWGLIKRFNGAGVWPKTAGAKCPATAFSAADTGDAIVSLGDSAASGYYFHPSVYRMQCDPSQLDAAGSAAYGTAHDTMNWYSDNTWEDPKWFTNGIAAPDTAATEAFLQGIVLNTWYKLSQPKVPEGDRAWSSTIFDPDQDQFLKFGGGHVAHCGTDVDHYSVHANRYAIGYRPEYPLDYNGDNECRPGPFTFNNRPFMNVHNTHGYDYDINLHRMIFVAGAHTYVYNPDIMDWDKAHIHSIFGSGGYNTGLVQTPHGVACAYGNSYGTNGVYLFDKSAMNWKRLSNSGDALPTFYADNSGVIYDSKRDRLIIAQGDANAMAHLWSFDFVTGVVAKLYPADSAFTTANDGHYRDLVYLPFQDIVVFGIRLAQGHLAYDCNANAWKYYPIALDASVTGSATLDDRGAGYMYDARRNLVWVSDYNCGVFVMRPDPHYLKLSLPAVSKEITAVFSAFASPRTHSVRISFTTESRDIVVLGMYDADGRLVKRIFNQARLYPGRHCIIWDGRDSRGRECKSGTFFCTLSVSGTCQVRRLVVMR